MITPESKHGGARPGSGPKPKPELRKKRISFTLPPEQVAWLKQQKNASKAVQDLIAQAMQNPRL